MAEVKQREKIAQLMPRAQSRALVLAGLGEWLKQRPEVELRLRFTPPSVDPQGLGEVWVTLAIDGGKELNVFERLIEPTAVFVAIEKTCQLYERKFDPELKPEEKTK